eukprot:2834966-Pleurochrysis_carterae.AAC.1
MHNVNPQYQAHSVYHASDLASVVHRTSINTSCGLRRLSGQKQLSNGYCCISWLGPAATTTCVKHGSPVLKSLAVFTYVSPSCVSRAHTLHRLPPLNPPHPQPTHVRAGRKRHLISWLRWTGRTCWPPPVAEAISGGSEWGAATPQRRSRWNLVRLRTTTRPRRAHEASHVVNSRGCVEAR